MVTIILLNKADKTEFGLSVCKERKNRNKLSKNTDQVCVFWVSISMPERTAFLI